MGYLKNVGTFFIYLASVLALITVAPGLPPYAEFSEYSIVPPKALEGVYAVNEQLNGAELLFRGKVKGAEAFDWLNGELYTGTLGGWVGRITDDKIVPVVKFGKDCAGPWEEEKCGRPLGLKFDVHGQLYVVDTYYGIFKVNVRTDKPTYERIVDPAVVIDGKVPMTPNSLDVAENGDVYWTDSSTEFKLFDGVFAFLANPSGRLIRYNAATKKNEVLLKNLGYANGVKLSHDESHLILTESMKSTILKYHLKGSKAGKSEVLIEGLPGMPDNVHSDGFGNYLVSMVVPADPEHPQMTQTLTPHPFVRKMLARLLTLIELPFKLLEDLYPNDIAKKAIHALGSFSTVSILRPRGAVVLRIDASGKILNVLHNTDETIAAISSAYVHKGYLWLGSPENDYIARVPLDKAFPNGEFSRDMRNDEKITRGAAANVEKPPVTRKVEATTTTPKPTTTTPRPTTTTPRPTTTTPRPTTTTPRPTTTTPRPTTTTPRPTTTTPRPTTTTTPRPATTTTQKPTTTAPKPVPTRAPEQPQPRLEQTQQFQRAQPHFEAEQTQHFERAQPHFEAEQTQHFERAQPHFEPEQTQQFGRAQPHFEPEQYQRARDIPSEDFEYIEVPPSRRVPSREETDELPRPIQQTGSGVPSGQARDQREAPRGADPVNRGRRLDDEM